MNEKPPYTHQPVEPQELGYAILHCVDLSGDIDPVSDTDQETMFEVISEEVPDIIPRAGTTTIRVKGVTTNKDGSWEWDELELSKEDK